jgi:PKD repeat protein
VTPTTTLAKETGNNTSTANSFLTQTNGNTGANNVSKVPLRNLFYNGSHTKLYAHLMPWFGTSSHINVGYNSATLAQTDKQVADMVSRGFDGTILDWYGPKNTQVNQASLYLMQSAQAAGSSFSFAIMEDVGALSSCANTSGCNLNTQVISDLTYINSTFAVSPNYMRVGGRPAIFFFGLEKYTLDWNAIRAGVPGNPLFIFRNAGAFTKTQSNGGFGWVSINTTNANDIGISYLDYFYSTALKYPAQQTYGTAYKGFNDTLALWTANRIMNQNCGQTWLSTFAELSKYYSASNELANFQVATWNDYEEGTEIESGIDNCVTVSGGMSGTVVNWGITGQENTIDHYTVFISTDGQNLMPVADVPAGTHSLDLSGYGFGAANYTLYVKAVGKPSLTNKMSGPITWLMTNQPPLAQLSVTPNSGIAPVTVNADASASVDPDGKISTSSIDFGDGTIVNAAIASHSYASAGNYVVTARVTDNMGMTSSTTQMVNIVANQPPVSRLTVTPASGIAPVQVTADSTASSDADGKVVSGTISFGDGTVVSGQVASHTYSNGGTYTIIATVTDDRGASGTSLMTVTVAPHAAPSVTLSVTPLSGTAPVNVTAFAWASSTSLATPSVVINWGDGSAVSSANTATHTYSLAGSYTVTATATDSLGYKSTATAVVSVARGSVQVVSPADNSVVTPQVHVVAGATSGAPITGMKIYLDGVPVYAISTVSKIDTYVKAGKGSHLLVVQAWDSTGAIFRSPVNITVK